MAIVDVMFMMLFSMVSFLISFIFISFALTGNMNKKINKQRNTYNASQERERKERVNKQDIMVLQWLLDVFFFFPQQHNKKEKSIAAFVADIYQNCC